MSTNSWTSAKQCDEEIVKRVLAVAELLSKGFSTDPKDVTSETFSEGDIKTQGLKASVSS